MYTQKKGIQPSSDFNEDLLYDFSEDENKPSTPPATLTFDSRAPSFSASVSSVQDSLLMAAERTAKEKLIAELNASTYKGMGFPLGHRGYNENEDNAVTYLEQIHEPKMLLELFQTITAMASATKNVAYLVVKLTSKIVETKDANIILQATNCMLSLVQKMYTEDLSRSRSLVAYLRACAELYESNLACADLSERYKATFKGLQAYLNQTPSHIDGIYTKELLWSIAKILGETSKLPTSKLPRRYRYDPDQSYDRYEEEQEIRRFVEKQHRNNSDFTKPQCTSSLKELERLSSMAKRLSRGPGYWAFPGSQW